jgi:hypothetical protein
LYSSHSSFSLLSSDPEGADEEGGEDAKFSNDSKGSEGGLDEVAKSDGSEAEGVACCSFSSSESAESMEEVRTTLILRSFASAKARFPSFWAAFASE